MVYYCLFLFAVENNDTNEEDDEECSCNERCEPMFGFVLNKPIGYLENIHTQHCYIDCSEQNIVVCVVKWMIEHSWYEENYNSKMDGGNSYFVPITVHVWH